VKYKLQTSKESVGRRREEAAVPTPLCAVAASAPDDDEKCEGLEKRDEVLPR
jgi:hypothetical protein